MPSYYTQSALNTTDPYIKYGGNILYVHNSYPSNSSHVIIRITAYNTNGSGDSSHNPYIGYTAKTYVKIDGGTAIEQTKFLTNGIDWGHAGEDGTTVFELDTNIEHELDGTKTTHFEVKFEVLDSNSEVVVTSAYQGFYVEFERIRRQPGTNIAYSIKYITEHSISLFASAGNPDWFQEWQANQYAYWFYTTDNGEHWYDAGFSVIDNPQPIRDYTDGTRTTIDMRGLEPDTTYTIILAVSSDYEMYRPGDTPENDNPNNPKFGYSAKINLTTDGVNPIPDVPSTRGVARRITLFDETEREFTSNGLGSLIEAFSCTVTEEINGIFELEMEYPVDGRHFNDIDFGRLITANPNQYSRPQPFRIYAISKPHDGKVTINAQHISYDLSGITVKPFRAGSAMGVLAEFKYETGGVCDVECPFNFWTDLSSYQDFRTYTPATIRQLLGGGDNSLLGVYGGEYEYDVFNVRLWYRRGVDRGVVIRYGKNLTSLKQDANCSNVYTGVRPFWYKEPSEDNPADGGLVDLPEKIINIEGTFEYTKILLLDLSSNFDEKPTEADLRDAANQYILDNNVGVPVVSLTVSFVQLSDSLEYQDIAILEQVKLGDYVSVDFPKLNIRATGIECVKTVFNVMSQRYDSIDLGTPKSTLSNTVASNSQAASNSVSRSEMQHAINVNGNDSSGEQKYVVIDRTVSPDRLYVMDKATKSIADKVFKFSFDGLSYSSTGINGPYSMVMPIDCSEFNLPGTISCVELDQTTPNLEVKNGHILKQIRW